MLNKQGKIDSVLKTLQDFLPTNHLVPLHEPLFRGNENKYVKECIDTGWVSSLGKFVDRFEEDLAAYTGVKRAVAVANGTSALHICLVLAGVKAGDEVLVPALTFVATANAVVYCQAVPHFVDSCYETLGVDPDKLAVYLSDIAEVKNGVCYNKQTGRRISAVVPMHTFGHPVDMDKIIAVAEEYNLVVVEDCAESIGSFYKGKHTGNFGLVSAMSFNGNKTITTGGGGAVLTNDEELGRFAKHLTTQAKIPHKWEFRHDMVGYNYRMPNINAALGCAQLEQLPEFLEKKRSLAEKYRQVFAKSDVVDFFVEPEFAKSNYWFNALILKPAMKYLRDDMLALLNDNNIMSRPIWNLMYTLEMYQNCPRMDCSVAKDIGRRLINIPSSVVLGD
ncbi:perosamine synthetase [Selenomonas ruminantium]|uniref:Perosamine synthetase n=1 Tax=Selenomonas ruminantium TaxID=971 RepID=A0A1I3CPF7_SELRU|nr:LegC family aminotransferase [Selenomonas ruminantium]SFH76253.1 perosamine synthetase [Selenomonas ruminantium]